MHRFEVWAPLVKKMAVHVAGARPAMQGPDERGWWRVEVEAAGPGSDYGFLVDDETWAIRYIEAATRNWWPGKRVLVSPDWIERVSWPDSKVYTGLTREAIENGPEYTESMPITREFENRLYFHYGRPPYWLRQMRNPNE